MVEQHIAERSNRWWRVGRRLAAPAAGLVYELADALASGDTAHLTRPSWIVVHSSGLVVALARGWSAARTTDEPTTSSPQGDG
jgi:hypothetical protein